ncbi:MAG: CDP-alcohol phosphatidyltransferase family protein [Thermoleophilaceae bacterium]|nr:CDP-alcohol phosphatidyltransferase family protein [Thermoleophilaceae bacterium]
MARERGFKRIAGIDRSGGPDERTRSDQPWRPWTIPNFIGYARALLIPIFFVLAWQSPDGRDTTANIALFICGVSDYLDGLAARATGQFSRLGTLLDPLIDRLMIIAAGIIIYKFELLPSYLVLLIFAREILMLVLSVPALMKGVSIHVNWIGRLAVWPLMAGGMLALSVDTWLANVLVWIGVIGSYAASWLYFRSVWPQLRAKPQPQVEP